MARKSIESNTLKSRGWIMNGKSKTLQKQKQNTKSVQLQTPQLTENETWNEIGILETVSLQKGIASGGINHLYTRTTRDRSVHDLPRPGQP